MKRKYYFGHDLSILKLNLGLILIIKLVIMFSFLIWLLVINDRNMLNLMVDQFLYLKDIENISSDIKFLFESDDEYYANHTLYSRLTGFFAWCIQLFTDKPIVSAVIVNVILHCFIAYYSTKLYLFYSGRNPMLFLYMVAFSPTIMAYSFFALRDLAIVLVTVLYVYFLSNRKILKAAFIIIPVLFLRPLLLVFLIFATIASLFLRRLLRSNYKLMYTFFMLVVLFTVGFSVVSFTGYQSTLNAFSNGLSVFEYFIQAFGFGTFVSENESVAAGRGAVNMTRIFMIDSILAPPIALLGMIIFASKGDLKQKEISMLTIFLLLLMAYSYVSITGRYAFRKILPVFPFLLITATLLIEHRRNKKIKSTDHLYKNFTEIEQTGKLKY